uniref:Probable butyrate kinase n=1 Tax=candidate division WOR-3 bacterium TaxID=2052148 RepID=A0A7C4CCB0_UNCW3
MWILVVNPGGGSTKVAVFRGRKQVFADNIQHPPAELSRFRHVLDQYRLRMEAVLDSLKRHRFELTRLNAIITRGGPLLPLPSGIYRITSRVVFDIQSGRYQTLHPSLLGPLIGYELAGQLNIPAYFADPESSDEFIDVARVSGLKGIQRRALSHMLSCRTVAEAAARRLKRPRNRCRFVVCHLGTGITIAAHVNGRQVDASNANDEGPFSPQRSGTLPLSAIVRLCFSGRNTAEGILDAVHRRGGLLSLLGTDDIRQVEALADRGVKEADLVWRALVYQIAKEVGAYTVACGGTPDAIIFTGGLAKSTRLIRALKARVRFLCPRIYVFPGEEELPAMAVRLLSLLEGKEKPRDYEQEVAVR